MRFGLLILAAVLAACGGCQMGGRQLLGAIEPETVVELEPPTVFKPTPTIRVRNTKNTSVFVRDMEFGFNKTSGEGHFKVGEVSLIDDASGVINADAARLPIVAEASRRMYEHLDLVSNNILDGWKSGIELGKTIAPLAFPGLAIKGPLGGSATVNSAATQSLIEALAPAIEKMVNDAIGKAAVEGKFRAPATPDPAEGAPDPLTP